MLPRPHATPNPNGPHKEADHTRHVENATITLETSLTVPALHGKGWLTVTYTPDKDLITPASFTTWLDTLIREAPALKTWEELTGAITDIFYDTLLPKSITLSLDIEGRVNHSITMQKSQPE